MSYSDKPFWPRGTDHDTQVGLGDNPKRIDLGKPDAAAAKLAETLQTATANTLFTRIVLMLTRSGSFIAVWILRPLFWWPLKAFLLAAVWTNTPNENSRRNQRELERRWELQRREQSSRMNG